MAIWRFIRADSMRIEHLHQQQQSDEVLICSSIQDAVWP